MRKAKAINDRVGKDQADNRQAAVDETAAAMYKRTTSLEQRGNELLKESAIAPTNRPENADDPTGHVSQAQRSVSDDMLC